ncbi:hypothetical protein NM688_g1216 [Phlebia brevispora]|uniref:Uncharacterized protein n=1 Tax=Phlebia brevispora TaxID=194682 RepID=A0ACC1TBU0_9APHY|nr:hypothetical protein NM688_g1216 [Phlebia brevispora]
MMNSKGSLFLDLLPTELLVGILERLPYEDLLSCKAVCRRLYTLVKECTSLQYTAQLAITGMEDNPRNTLSKSDKLIRLKDYRRIWDNLAAEDATFYKQHVPIRDGPAWELTGGVLSQNVGSRAIEFKQLPSRLRGIEEKTWKVEFGFDIRDFTADPGQDLLVVVQAMRKKECRVRFLSMSTGQRHREARHETVSFERRTISRPSTHEIRVNGPYVGVLVKEIHTAAGWCHLSVWDWRTAEEVYSVTHRYWSFCFFQDCFLLLAEFTPPEVQSQGSLVVVDLANTDAPPRRLDLLPCLAGATSIYNMELLCEPGSRWAPPSGQNPPFHVSREDRLIVLLVHVTDDRLAEDYALTFSMLASKLASYVDKSSAEKVNIPWCDWGTDTCRATESAFFWEGIWPCCVYGTKHVVQEDNHVVIYDFNPHAIREQLLPGPSPNGNVEVVTLRSQLEEQLFEGDIITTLPFRKIKTNLAISEIDSVMLSEDTIVIVEDEREKFRIASL